MQETSLVGSVHTSSPLSPMQTVRSENGGVDSSARNDSGISSDVHHVFKSSMLPASLPAGDVSGKTKVLYFRSSTLKKSLSLYCSRKKT